jgi:hypothetical protein
MKSWIKRVHEVSFVYQSKTGSLRVTKAMATRNYRIDKIGRGTQALFDFNVVL